MQKITVDQCIKRLFKLRESGECATLLGIGPMSRNLITAVFELARDRDFPVMFIASRNQVDADELGGGYVCSWNQATFKRDIDAVAKEVGFDGLYYLCRDHGGPWQRDKERNDALPAAEAMALGKKSFVYDLESGFDLLHIDPTKVPSVDGVVPMELVLDYTVELLEFCEAERKQRGLPAVSYEVGTEETNGGITQKEDYRRFIDTLVARLEQKKLPLPSFIVGNTGTLTRLCENVGNWDAKTSAELGEIAAQHGVGLKEHNGDYLSEFVLSLHPAIGITATNVAPEYGYAESVVLLRLARVEKELAALGILEQASDFERVFTLAAANCGRWRKWMVGERRDATSEDVLADPEFSQLIVELAGHYTYMDADVVAAQNRMYENLERAGLMPERLVVDAIKASVSRYVDCFNLEGLTSRLLAAE